MIKIPTQQTAIKTSKQFGSLAAGFILANLAKVALFEPKADGTSVVTEKPIYTGLAFGASLVGAMMVKNELLQLGLLGFATYTGIRSLNKVTEKLTGLGNDGQPSKLKEYLQKYLPNLSGLGEVSPLRLPSTNFLNENFTMARIAENANAGGGYVPA